MRLILASQSPYRKELLERLQIPFETIDSQLDELPFQSAITDPKRLSSTLAKEKAKKVFNDNPDAFVIGSDQVPIFLDQCLGKPETMDRAISQLMLLQGGSHQLITAVSIYGPENTEIHFHDITTLVMRNLTKTEIENYLNKDNPLKCAGSYKIESLGISLFSKILTEDFTSIVGLPLMQLANHLRSLGFHIP